MKSVILVHFGLNSGPLWPIWSILGSICPSVSAGGGRDNTTARTESDVSAEAQVTSCVYHDHRQRLGAGLRFVFKLMDFLLKMMDFLFKMNDWEQLFSQADSDGKD